MAINRHDIQDLKQIDELIEKHGGFDGEHSGFPVREWITDVSCGNTRLGYWEWVHNEIYGI